MFHVSVYKPYINFLFYFISGSFLFLFLNSTPFLFRLLSFFTFITYVIKMFLIYSVQVNYPHSIFLNMIGVFYVLILGLFYENYIYIAINISWIFLDSIVSVIMYYKNIKPILTQEEINYIPIVSARIILLNFWLSFYVILSSYEMYIYLFIYLIKTNFGICIFQKLPRKFELFVDVVYVIIACLLTDYPLLLVILVDNVLIIYINKLSSL